MLCVAQMMEHHLLQSTLQGAFDHVIEKHPANPNPKKTAKRRRLRKKADQPKDLVELAQVGFSILHAMRADMWGMESGSC